MPGMRRREFVSLLGGAAAAWPLAARAQQAAMPVIGFLGSDSRRSALERCVRFARAWKKPVMSKGGIVAIEYRWAQGRNDRLPDLAADLIRRRVAVIALANSPSALPLRRRPRRFRSSSS